MVSLDEKVLALGAVTLSMSIIGVDAYFVSQLFEDYVTRHMSEYEIAVKTGIASLIFTTGTIIGEEGVNRLYGTKGSFSQLYDDLNKE